MARGQVMFQRSARKARHTHPLGQTHMVTTGCGWCDRAAVFLFTCNPFSMGEVRAICGVVLEVITQSCEEWTSSVPSSVGRLHLRDSVLMTIHALDPMNVVSAGCTDECRIHLLHVQAAVGHLRVTRLAR